MVETAAWRLRNRVWSLSEDFRSQKEVIASKMGEGGKDAVKRLLEMVEQFRAKFIATWYELQVKDDDSSKELEKKFEHFEACLVLLETFHGEASRHTIAEAKQVVEKLQLVTMMDIIKPSAEKKEVSYGDADKKKIVGMLTEANADKLLVIPIIGMPGTGKSSLVQQVYQEKRVLEYFNVRHLVCLSGIHADPSKLLDLVYRQKLLDDDVLEKFHSIVDGKRYLLILDGVTQEVQGTFLHDLLRYVSHGSKVILTSSNMAIHQNLAPLPVAEGAPFGIEIPSRDERRRLFKSIAFSEGAEEGDPNNNISDLVSEICNKYAHMPRLLKNIAGLVHTTTTDWANFRDIEDSVKTFLSKVNLDSTKELPSNIQRCVLYCSLFPKNYEFSKTYLIHLWDAQEYLSTEEKRPDELVGDEYFRELQNSEIFFDHTNTDKNSAIINFNMDSLVTKFLRSVAKPEFCLMDEDDMKIDTDNVLHLSFPVVESKWEAPSQLRFARRLKSLLFLPCNYATVGSVLNIDEILSNLKSLQVLDLVGVNCEGLTDSLALLTDLRYLRLGVSSEGLPPRISNLTKLQTLDLRHSSVIILPKEFHKLVGLRHLYTGGRLMDMPPDFGKLTSLKTLDAYIVGKNNGLDALGKLDRLIGKLKIRFDKQYETNGLSETSILKDKFLTDISFIWSASYGEPTAHDWNCLQLPPSLKSLAVCRWKGESFPPQLMDSFAILGNLVSLHIEDCSSCLTLPGFSALPHLRSLQLWNLSALKYIETGADSYTTSSTVDYFPSLNSLMLANLPKLEGWSPRNDGQQSQHIFPSLLEFKVSGCPILMSMPQMQSLESLEAHHVDEALLKDILSCQSVSSASSTIKKLTIVAVKLNSFFINWDLESLVIRRCSLLRNLIIESSHLKQLEIHECGLLADISTADPTHSGQQDGDSDEQSGNRLGEGGAWQRIKFLRSLKLINNSSMKSLPEGIRCLDSLEELYLHSFYKLTDLPVWIGNFTQLHRLVIQNFPLLTSVPSSSALKELELHYCPRLEILKSDFKSVERPNFTKCPKLQRAHQQTNDLD